MGFLGLQCVGWLDSTGLRRAAPVCQQIGGGDSNDTDDLKMTMKFRTPVV